MSDTSDMKKKNPIRPRQRERRLDLSGSGGLVAHPGRLDLFSDSAAVATAREQAPLIGEKTSVKPQDWALRHLARRHEALRGPA